MQFLALCNLILGEIHCFSQQQAISMKASEKTTIATVCLMGNVFGTVQCPQAWQRLSFSEPMFIDKKVKSAQETGKVIPTQTVKRHYFFLSYEDCHTCPMVVVNIHWKKQSVVSKNVNFVCEVLH